MTLRTPETATPEAIKRLAKTNLDLIKENKDLKKALKLSLQALNALMIVSGSQIAKEAIEEIKILDYELGNLNDN